MSVLIVGVSHNSAPVSLLERLAAPGADSVHKLVSDAAGCAHVAEATVISTCNRLEIYADVERFHGSVEQLSTLLVQRSGVSTEALLPHLYVHYDDGAVAHLFQVAAGLDSMAVGEGQILGQTREALRLGQELGTVGPALNVLFQQALRVGKRSRAETGIDRAAPSLVTAALERARPALGDVAGRSVAVLGAGAMAGLATATVSRLGAADIVVLNRTPERAARLAAEYAGRPAPVDSLASELAGVDQAIAIAKAAAESVKVMMPGEASPGAIGPISNGNQYQKVQDLIETGIKEGATLVAGGPGRPEGFNKGYFAKPTVFANVTNDMTIAREEIFGPVLTMIPFDTEEEAMNIANDTVYGLTNYVQTQDGAKANRVALKLRSGMVEMNGQPRGAGAPFGGMKQSGNGREGGVWGIEDFTEVKAIGGWAVDAAE